MLGVILSIQTCLYVNIMVFFTPISRVKLLIYARRPPCVTHHTFVIIITRALIADIMTTTTSDASYFICYIIFVLKLCKNAVGI